MPYLWIDVGFWFWFLVSRLCVCLVARFCCGRRGLCCGGGLTFARPLRFLLHDEPSSPPRQKSARKKKEKGRLRLQAARRRGSHKLEVKGEKEDTGVRTYTGESSLVFSSSLVLCRLVLSSLVESCLFS